VDCHLLLDGPIALTSDTASSHDYLRAPKYLIDFLRCAWNVLKGTDNWMLRGGRENGAIRSLQNAQCEEFFASWVRRVSVGTTTSSLGQRAETSKEIIVSVLPVPVGMTMVAGASDTANVHALHVQHPFVVV